MRRRPHDGDALGGRHDGVHHAVVRLLELMLELKVLNGRCRVYWHAPPDLADVR